jgi:hypothetical protein
MTGGTFYFHGVASPLADHSVSKVRPLNPVIFISNREGYTPYFLFHHSIFPQRAQLVGALGECLVSFHPETPDVKLSVFSFETSNFSSWQGSQEVARRRFLESAANFRDSES